MTRIEVMTAMAQIFLKLPKLKNISELGIIHTEEQIMNTFYKCFESLNKNSSVEENCPICLDTLSEMQTTLPCLHTFCKACLDLWLKDNNRCPICKTCVQKLIGNQPDGSMSIYKDQFPLPGYEKCGTIIIHYYFPPGFQGSQHPNPGVQYSGTNREAYLPDNQEGNEVLNLLRMAWDQKLLFTVGQSLTTGMDNSIIWNDIHHKTNRNGGPAQ